MAMDVAEQLLKDNYGASASQSPMLMAGAYPRKSPVTYVVAALTDEPMTGVITTLEQATLHLADATMREYISLALTSVQRLLGSHKAESAPLPPGCILGHDMPAPVAVETAQTKEGTSIYEARQVQDLDDMSKARRALQHASPCAARTSPSASR